jgi:microsomal dipeptidase-like Zn-dependent dipeptidase
MFVLDSHCDTPTQIFRGRDLAKDNEAAHVDFPKIKRGGVDGAFFALYIPADMEGDAALEHAEKLYACVMDTLAANADKAVLTMTQEQAYANKSNGLFSVFLGLENGSPIGKSLDRLREFYAKGVRYMTLCHTKDNEICDSCASAVKTWHGLSPFGKEVVAEMNRLGMLIDVSHASTSTLYDIIKLSKAPIFASHSSVRAIKDHPRNLTDQEIKDIAATGGVIQIATGRWCLTNVPKSETKIVHLADHIDHIKNLVGPEHIGLGTDFDGGGGMVDFQDCSKMKDLTVELLRRGYTEKELEMFWGGNFMRVWEQTIKVAQ